MTRIPGLRNVNHRGPVSEARSKTIHVKHVLITGGAGFIGSHLAEALIADDCRVTVLDDESTGTAENLAGVREHFNFSFVQGSAADKTLVRSLVSDVDESIFSRVSELGSDILKFRKVLLPARATLTELATRKSPFISDETQVFLSRMLATLDRTLQDLLVARDILSESLDLHMSLVAHRTNRVITRLTAVSIVFLPLTFLCGVYGMNFEILPELAWPAGYPLFWLVVVLVTTFQLVLLRRKKLI